MKDILTEYGKSIITAVIAIACVLMVLNIVDNKTFNEQVQKQQDVAIMVAAADPPRIDPEQFLTKGIVLDQYEEHYYRDDVVAKLSNGVDISNHVAAFGDVTDDGRIDTSTPGVKIVKFKVFFDDNVFTKSQTYFVRGEGQTFDSFKVSGIARPNGTSTEGLAIQMLEAGTVRNWAYTDADGRFEFDYVMDGNYVAYTKTGGGVLYKAFTVSGDNLDIGELKFLANDTYHSVSGRLVANDTILQSQVVEVFDKDGNFVASNRSDDLGNFVIEYLQPGEYMFKVETEEDIFTRDFTMEATDLELGDVILNGQNAKFDVKGKAVAPFGVGLSGLEVSIFDQNTGDMITTVYTEADGSFMVRELMPGTYRIVCRFNEGDVEKTVVIDKESVDIGSVFYGTLRSVSGYVVDNAGEIVKNASVTILETTNNRSLTVKTNENGRFELTGIPDSTQQYQVSVETDYMSERRMVTVNGNDVDMGTIRLSTQYSAQGKVMYYGKEIAGVGVDLTQDGRVIDHVETDESGAFIFKNVANGNYKARVEDARTGRGELSFTMDSANIYIGVIELKDASYKIEYVLNTAEGESWLDSSEPGYQDGPYTYDSKTETLLPIAKKQGYEFVGWSVSKDGSNPMLSIPQYTSGDLVLYPVFQGMDITINFDGMGGEVSESIRVLKTGDAIGQLPTATRDGYTFDGWYTLDIGGERVTPQSKFSSVTTLYAHWSAQPIQARAKIMLKNNGENSFKEYQVVDFTIDGSVGRNSTYTLSIDALNAQGVDTGITSDGSGNYYANGRVYGVVRTADSYDSEIVSSISASNPLRVYLQEVGATSNEIAQE